MSVELIISLAAISLALISSAVALISLVRYRSSRKLLEFAEYQIEELREAIELEKQQLEVIGQKFSELPPRVAWLETRVRQPKQVEEEPATEIIPTGSLKPNMTERRHRILTLASRGQNADSIATTLGMMPGEVELILNLHHKAA
jgi:hypothetical protein